MGFRYGKKSSILKRGKQPQHMQTLFGWCGEPVAALWSGIFFLGLTTKPWTSYQLRSEEVAVNIFNER
jgi:hypothetical protein